MIISKLAAVVFTLLVLSNTHILSVSLNNCHSYNAVCSKQHIDRGDVVLVRATIGTRHIRTVVNIRKSIRWDF